MCILSFGEDGTIKKSQSSVITGLVHCARCLASFHDAHKYLNPLLH